MKEGVDLLFNKGMEASFEGAALCWVGEDLGGKTLTLVRVGDERMRDIIRIDRLDA